MLVCWFIPWQREGGEKGRFLSAAFRVGAEETDPPAQTGAS